MDSSIITAVSINDFDIDSGNYLTDNIIVFLDEIFKTTDKILLSENELVYTKSEILDLANVIINLIEKENEKEN